MTQILVCADHGTPNVPDGSVQSVPGLCFDPALLSAIPDHSGRLVLGIHPADVDLSRLQSTMRRFGLDPLAVGILDLTSGQSTDRLIPALAGIVARTEAFPGSTPEQTKLEPPRRVSRRALLLAPAALSVGAPAIESTLCVAKGGCRACVTNCPVDALSWHQGVVSYDKTSCVTCGICVTTCPTGAIVDPTVTPHSIEAQIRAIVDAATMAIGIRFVCRTAVTAPQEGYFDISVACTGMLTPGWLLAPLLLGASAANALPCSPGGCPLDNDIRLERTVEDAMRILDVLGLEPGPLETGYRSATTPFPPTTAQLFGPGVDASVIDILAKMAEADPAARTLLRSAQVGSVAIHPSSCTACQMCAHLCPTHALVATELIDAIAIDFDPRVCVACGQCLSICPEFENGAVSLTVGFDLADWKEGRREIRRDTTPRCTRCGKPIAPSAMLDRIGAKLGPQHAGTFSRVSTVCLDCRGR